MTNLERENYFLHFLQIYPLRLKQNVLGFMSNLEKDNLSFHLKQKVLLWSITKLKQENLSFHWNHNALGWMTNLEQKNLCLRLKQNDPGPISNLEQDNHSKKKDCWRTTGKETRGRLPPLNAELHPFVATWSTHKSLGGIINCTIQKY